MDENLTIRPLVLGADGLLGRALTEALEERYPHTVSAGRTELDVTDRWRLEAELLRLQPTVVVNCAAVADVDACEADPERAQRVNAEAPAQLAAICRRAGVRLLHYSTDYVFDGAKRAPYDEADAPNPVNVYGRTKLEGEMGVLETHPDALVVRVSFVFGAGRATFLDKIVGLARASREPIPALDSWTIRPTALSDAVEATLRLVGSDATGLWHVAGKPAVTRLGFARELLRLIGDDPARAVALPKEALQLAAARPDYSVLSTARFEARFGPLRPWTAGAREYLGLPPAAPGEDPS